MNKNKSGWIPCSERLPEVETEVLACVQRNNRYVIIVAFFEDGTMHTDDSKLVDYCPGMPFDYCEETDDYIMPECWLENIIYDPYDDYYSIIPNPVIAWMPLPNPYGE